MKSENQTVLQSDSEVHGVLVSPRRKRVLKTVVLYFTMVTVSTVAIVMLEHATVANAIRTALVAAIGKTFAANWVTGIFE